MPIYTEAPNVVKITVEDKDGGEVRFIAGVVVDDVLSAISAKFGVPEATVAKPKQKRTRRTKAEMAKAAPEGVAPAHGSSVWPE